MMLKEKLRYLFAHIYQPDIDPKTLIEQHVSKDYQQVADYHRLDYEDFVSHILKQRELVEEVGFDFLHLVEEGNCVASLHQVSAVKKATGKKIKGELHAFFHFDQAGKIISCNERTQILEGDKADQNLGHVQ